MLTHLHYINLRRRPDRNAAFLAHHAQVAEFERVEGIEGAQYSSDELIRMGFMAEPLQRYTAGGIGNALTHRQLWIQTVEADRVLTVAEDDALFNHAFSQNATEILQQLPPDWDFVLWGWNFDSILDVEVVPGLRRASMIFDSKPLGAQSKQFQSMRGGNVPLRLHGAFGTVCYSVSPLGARKLLSRCFPLRHETVWIPALGKPAWNQGIDVALNKIYGSLQAYATFPPLVWTENDPAQSDLIEQPSG